MNLTLMKTDLQQHMFKCVLSKIISLKLVALLDEERC